ncbi:MAG: GntR family transcriptional regulator [Alphaproteobacteria bacterium]|nr:GntR family transcriptional regulator [Alphaproteobacteria bacterium]
MSEQGKRDSKAIVDDVIARIRRNELRPGEHLKEKDLADYYGTSRGPVREALKALEARLWLTRESVRGLRVASAADEQSIDAVWISSVLLGLCARLAAMRATPEEQDDLFATVRRLKAAADSPIDTGDFIMLAQEPWFKLSASARSAQLTLFFENSFQSALRTFARKGFERPVARQELAQLWLELAVAIKTRNTTRAEDIARQIPTQALDEVLRQTGLEEERGEAGPVAWLGDPHRPAEPARKARGKPDRPKPVDS